MNSFKKINVSCYDVICQYCHDFNINTIDLITFLWHSMKFLVLINY